MTVPPDQIDVAVIGGGAAGFFGAIACAEANPRLRVAILEKSGSVLAKVRISGGGRCNVTHSCFDPAELVRRYPRGERELRGPFHSWQPADTVKWFESRGVPLKTESDGRMFPVTDSSQTIIECLLESARKAGVEIFTHCGLAAARVSNGGGFELTLSGEDSGKLLAKYGAASASGYGVPASAGSAPVLRCRKLLLATGGLGGGPLGAVIKGFGHTIAPLAPSLFTFKIRDPRLTDLQGLSVDHAVASIPGAKFEQLGPVLVTHWGLSGPAILKLSAWAARWIQERQYRFTCRVNWIAGENPQSLGQALRKLKQEEGRKPVLGTPRFGLPRRLWNRLVEAAGVSEHTPWSQVSGKTLDALAVQLTACDFTVEGKSMNKDEFVTCGGVSLKEIHFKTMESRLVPGLHFAGEVLDIDGVTGGFNFQAAWTGGLLAGRALAAER